MDKFWAQVAKALKPGGTVSLSCTAVMFSEIAFYFGHSYYKSEWKDY